MASDGGSSDDECRGSSHHTWPVFRASAKAKPNPVVSNTAAAAKRARRLEMGADGYSEWQMTRAEAQRVVNGVADTEGVVQSVYRYANAGSQSVEPEPEPMSERVAAMTEPVTLIPPACREFLPASIPGVTVVRPWADIRYYITPAVALRGDAPSP